MKTCPMAYKISQSQSKIFPNHKGTPKNAQDFDHLAKMAKFRQIWSHCQNKKSVELCQDNDWSWFEHGQAIKLNWSI